MKNTNSLKRSYMINKALTYFFLILGAVMSANRKHNVRPASVPEEAHPSDKSSWLRHILHRMRIPSADSTG